MVEPQSGFESSGTDSVALSLERLDDALAKVSGVSALASDARAVHDAAYDLADVIDQLVVHRDAVLDADAEATDLRVRLQELFSANTGSTEVMAALQQALRADDEAALDELWDQIVGSSLDGIDPALAQRVYVVRGHELAFRSRAAELAAAFDDASVVLSDSVSGLLSEARVESSAALVSSVRSFD